MKDGATFNRAANSSGVMMSSGAIWAAGVGNILFILGLVRLMMGNYTLDKAASQCNTYNCIADCIAV
jgi:hypothetical protein